MVKGLLLVLCIHITIVVLVSGGRKKCKLVPVKDAKGTTGYCCQFNRSTNTKEDVIKFDDAMDKVRPKVIVKQANRNAFDVQDRCPDGAFIDQYGNCIYEF